MAEASDEDYLLKYIIIGDADVGKSCILRYFVERKFSKKKLVTIGVEFGSRMIRVKKRKVKMQIWDTAGQEKFRSVTRSYYRGAICALLVYDITNRASFEHLQGWLEDAKHFARPDINLIIVGNKLDRRQERQVSLLEASQFANEHNVAFLEASAQTGDCIDEVFSKTASTILEKIDDHLLDPQSLTANVHQPIDQPSSGVTKGCCR